MKNTVMENSKMLKISKSNYNVIKKIYLVNC
jgi:hypothetical protein